jgi:hypothetical protein
LSVLNAQQADPMQGQAHGAGGPGRNVEPALTWPDYPGFINIWKFQQCYTSYQYFHNASFLEEIP